MVYYDQLYRNLVACDCMDEDAEEVTRESWELQVYVKGRKPSRA